MQTYKNSIALAVALYSPLLFGWGLVVPNGDKANQFYQVIDGHLIRYNCPEGTIPTSVSCINNAANIGQYSRIRSSVEYELRQIVSKLQTDITNEIRNLKENDANVKSLRQQVKEYASKVDAVAAASVTTEREIHATKHNLGLIAGELKLIGEALKREPSEAELDRLLERRKRYESLQQRYNAQLAQLERELANSKLEKDKLMTLIQDTNTKLSEYLKQLVVSSPNLTRLESAKRLYDQEIDLLPEMDARLTDKLAYELSEWDEPGSVELFARMVRHCGK